MVRAVHGGALHGGGSAWWGPVLVCCGHSCMLWLAVLLHIYLCVREVAMSCHSAAWEWGVGLPGHHTHRLGAQAEPWLGVLQAQRG